MDFSVSRASPHCRGRILGLASFFLFFFFPRCIFSDFLAPANRPQHRPRRSSTKSSRTPLSPDTDPTAAARQLVPPHFRLPGTPPGQAGRLLLRTGPSAGCTHNPRTTSARGHLDRQKMSSAPQTVPQQPPPSVSAVHTPPLAPAAPPANRQYPSAHSSPAREGPDYHATRQPSGASSTSSSRRPSRGPAANHDTPQFAANSPMSSRAAVASPVPVPVPSSPADPPDPHGAAPDKRRTMPAAVPPRTSSSRRATTAAAAAAAADSSRRAYPDSIRDANGRIDPSDPSRSRRTNPPAHEQHVPNGARDAPANASMSLPVRSSPAPSTSLSAPSREASEVLNSILVSQPEVDIEREKERLALAQQNQATTSRQDDDAAPPPVVARSDHADDARRGGRSRHDHSRREKQTRFGEYILGNTIGEGEFGKVKLGWKQEGGVQVRRARGNRLRPLVVPG